MERIKEDLRKLEEIGQLREIPNISAKFGNELISNDTKYVNFASNDYLGISTDMVLREEFLAKNKSLLSSASARLLSGTSSEFKELETTLSKLFQKEACLIFNTGYQCNLGVISTLISKNDVVFSDKLNHASIIDGMKLSEGDFIRYKHLDYGHLEELLIKNRSKYNRAIIISESIFSMDGDCAYIDKLIELKNKYNCLLMIDEAHAFGAFGNHFTGVSFNKDVDIITATFGKAIGSFGAFCIANNDIIKYLTNKARSFIFSTAIPPINIAWSNWLLTEKFEFLNSKKERLVQISKESHEILSKNGIKTVSCSHIIPILIGENNKTLTITEKLKAEGYYIPAIRPPTVQPGTSRLRVSLTANTDINDIEKIIRIVHEF